jgi:hypothetical protein
MSHQLHDEKSSESSTSEQEREREIENTVAAEIVRLIFTWRLPHASSMYKSFAGSTVQFTSGMYVYIHSCELIVVASTGDCPGTVTRTGTGRGIGTKRTKEG